MYLQILVNNVQNIGTVLELNFLGDPPSYTCSFFFILYEKTAKGFVCVWGGIKKGLNAFFVSSITSISFIRNLSFHCICH